MPETNNAPSLRALPRVDDVTEALEADEGLLEALGHEGIANACREAIAQAREAILSGREASVGKPEVVERARRTAKAAARPSLRRVVNATGVVLHTNLGRSPLADEASAAVLEASRGYSTLEYDVEAQARGSRHAHCERLLRELAGTEAAIAVNNNAAATLMVLDAFARGHEAVVSRGELVEIGGSFRIPDIMALSGARMVEVGATNKTHLSDYERAITPETSLLLKVHTSNYAVVGFSESVSAADLARVAAEENLRRPEGAGKVLVYEDLGSGSLVDPIAAMPGAEPTVRQAASRCDLVSFSGDKLLGGPQAGIIVGRKELIDRLKKHPFARAMRLDKMTLAALEATLRVYASGRAYEKIPILRMLNEPAGSVRARAERLARMAQEAIGELGSVSAERTVARSGGGSLPLAEIESSAAVVDLATGSASACEAFLAKRDGTPVIARIAEGKVLFDARTLFEEDLEEIARGLREYAERAESEGVLS